jgi:hypothetical protein
MRLDTRRHGEAMGSVLETSNSAFMRTRKEPVMPLIKPRTRGKQFIRLVTRLERETNETVYAYAAFLGEPVEYVLNELIDTVLAKDRDFVKWRADHPESHVPRRPAAKARKGSERAPRAPETAAGAHVAAPAAAR